MAEVVGRSTSARLTAIAAPIFLALILLQVPLFRASCKSGVCQSPLEVTAAQLVSSKAAPPRLVKAMLYPGACVHQFLTTTTLPSWDKLLVSYNMTAVEAPTSSDIVRLEVIAGSYFAVVGALIGIFKPGRMSVFGMLLICWGLIKEGQRTTGDGIVEAKPMLLFAVLLAFLSVRYNYGKVRDLARPVVKPLRSSAKTKLK